MKEKSRDGVSKIDKSGGTAAEAVSAQKSKLLHFYFAKKACQLFVLAIVSLASDSIIRTFVHSIKRDIRNDVDAQCKFWAPPFKISVNASDEVNLRIFGQGLDHMSHFFGSFLSVEADSSEDGDSDGESNVENNSSSDIFAATSSNDTGTSVGASVGIISVGEQETTPSSIATRDAIPFVSSRTEWTSEKSDAMTDRLSPEEQNPSFSLKLNMDGAFVDD
jgi:hypothetical protein